MRQANKYLKIGILTVLFVILFIQVNCGKGGNSTSGSSATPPALTAVTAVAGDTVITLTWNSSSVAITFDIYMATQTGVTKANYLSLPGGMKHANVTSPFVHTGLINGTVYYFIVTATNPAGQSATSTEVSAMPAVPVPPAAPTGVTAIPGDARITITWNAVVSATSYNMYMASQAGVTKANYLSLPNGIVHAGVTSPFAHPGLTNGVTYYFVMTALNSNGESVESSQVSATPFAPPPAAPTGVTATPGNAQITITWNSVLSATSYNLYMASQSGVTKATYLGLPDGMVHTNITSPFVHSALTNGVAYYFVMTALNANGESAESIEASATPVAPPVPPLPPSVVTAVPGNAQATVYWSPVTGATSYNMYMASQAGVTKANYLSLADGMVHTNITSPFVHPGLTNGVTYYFVVTTLNSFGESSESLEASAMPAAPVPPAAPTGVIATPGNTQVTIYWNAVAGATSYNMYMASQTGVTKANYLSLPDGMMHAGITSPFVHPALTNGVTYFFVMTALNVNGESVESTQARATPVASVPAQVTTLNPTDGAINIPITQTVSWGPASGATSYDVYFGGANPPFYLAATTTGTTYKPIALMTGFQYFWRIDSRNGSGVTTGNVWTFTTIISPGPFNLLSPANSATNVPITQTLTWSPSAFAEVYHVYFGAVGSMVDIATITGTSYTPAGMNYNTTYGWHIVSLDFGDSYFNGPSWTFTTIPLPPAQVASPLPSNGLTNTPITQKLSWATASSAASYDVYFGATSTGWAAVVTTTLKSYNPSVLEYATAYYWRIDSVNSAGTTTGIIWTFVTEPMPLPEQVIPLAPDNGLANVPISQVLNWFDALGATSYDVYLGATTTGWARVTSVDITSYTPNNPLQYSTLYYWRIDSVNAGGTVAGNVWTFVTEAPPPVPPAAPTGVTAIAGNTEITITWNSVLSATSYNLYMASQTGVTKTNYLSLPDGMVHAGVTSPFAHPGLVNGTAYFFVMTAVNANGESVESSQASATPTLPPPTAPTGVAIDVGGSSQAKITWNPVSGATSYNVYMASQTGVTKANYLSLPNGMVHANVTSPFVHTGLTAGLPYYFVVTALNANGESVESAQVSGTPQ